MNSHSYLNIVCCVLSFVTLLAIVCYYGRTFPLNYLLFIIFTLLEAYMISGFTAANKDMHTILAALATALVSISLTIYSMFTRYEVE